MVKFKGISKKDGKTLKGNLLNIGRKQYIVNTKKLTKFMGADYLLISGGADSCEVTKDSVEMIKKL